MPCWTALISMGLIRISELKSVEITSRVESGRCQKSKAADVKAADVAQSGRCCLKQPMIVRKRTMFVQKQPMIDLKRPMCPKAADVFAKSGRCPLRTKAADVVIFLF